MNILKHIDNTLKEMLSTKEEHKELLIEKQWQDHDCHIEPTGEGYCDICEKHWEIKRKRSGLGISVR